MPHNQAANKKKVSPHLSACMYICAYIYVYAYIHYINVCTYIYIYILLTLLLKFVWFLFSYGGTRMTVVTPNHAYTFNAAIARSG